MDIQSLIKLANQADLEGNYKVADKLTERAIREAVNRNVFQNMFGLRDVGPTLKMLLSGGAIKYTAQQVNPTDVKIKGKWFSAEDAVKVRGANADDVAMARPPRAARPAGARGGAGNTPPPSGPNAQSAVGGGVDQDINAGGPNAQAAVGIDGGGVEQTIGAPPQGGRRRRTPATPGTPATPATPGTPATTPPSGGRRRRTPGTTNQPGVDQDMNGDGPKAQAAVNNYIYGKGDKGDTGDRGLRGYRGYKGDTGKAGAWWPGVLAGLASGAITGATVAAYLRGRGADPDVIRVIQEKVNSQDFKANQLSARSSAGQMGNQQAAQNFIEARRGNPAFKTAQDFYYAAQSAGMNQSMMNQIAALAKAEGYRDLTRFRD